MLSGAVEGMSPAIVAFCLGVMFVAAFIRGYTGFGSSLLWVPSLSLVLPPVAVVPVTFMLELAVSLHLLPSIRRDVHWASLCWIWLGAAVGVPLGLAAIVSLPADMTRGAVAVTVIVAALLLWRGRLLAGTLVLAGHRRGRRGRGAVDRRRRHPGTAGLPLLPVGAARRCASAGHRSSPICWGLSPIACAFAYANGMLDGTAVLRAALLLPVVLAGSWLGAHAFGRADPGKGAALDADAADGDRRGAAAAGGDPRRLRSAPAAQPFGASSSRTTMPSSSGDGGR